MATKIDREEAIKKATGRLFFMEYRFTIPYMHFHNTEFLSKAGMVMSGDRLIDGDVVNWPVTTQQTPAHLAKYIDDGVTVTDLSPADAAAIYCDIEEYLDERKHIAKSTFDMDILSIEWVTLFEQLMNSLYSLACEHWINHPRQTKVRLQIPGLGNNVLGGSPLTRRAEPVQEPEAPPSNLPPRQKGHPAAAVIQDALQRRGLKPSE